MKHVKTKKRITAVLMSFVLVLLPMIQIVVGGGAAYASPATKVWVDITGTGGVSTPTNIAVGSDGTVYVSDTNNRQINQLSIEYTVSFDSKGGSTVDAQPVIINGHVTEPTAPTMADSTFKGWYSDTYLTNPFDFATTAITANQTLYAKWAKRVWIDITNSGNFYNPWGVAVGSDGTMYVADYSNKKIKKLTSGSSTWDDITYGGAFQMPKGIAVGSDGTVYVADVFFLGRKIKKLTSGSSTWDDITYSEGFNNPQAIAVGSNGTVYVADYTNNQIKKLTSGGSAWEDITNSGGFSTPMGIAVDSDGAVYVTDSTNLQIYKLPSGESTWVSIADLGGFNGPQAIAVGSDGSFYVADGGYNEIKKLTSGGSAWENITGSGGLDNPNGIAVGSDDNVYVSNSYPNNKIKKLSTVYTVSFDSNGGSPIVADQTVTKNTYATEPTDDPIMTGYTFGGWYSTSDLSGAPFSFATNAITADQALHAKWTMAAAAATIVAPVLGATPQNAAAIETETNNADYTVTSVTWNGALTAGSKFKAGQVYTATVVLTSKNAKVFHAGAFTPTVTGSSSVGDTTTTGSGVGNTVTFTVTYPETDALAVTSIAVTTQPTKMSYTKTTDDVLALNGMVVTSTNNDGSTTAVPFTSFATAGYTTSPANGATLTTAGNNGNPVTITHAASSQTATTSNLTVTTGGNTVVPPITTPATPTATPTPTQTPTSTPSSAPTTQPTNAVGVDSSANVVKTVTSGDGHVTTTVTQDAGKLADAFKQVASKEVKNGAAPSVTITANNTAGTAVSLNLPSSTLADAAVKTPNAVVDFKSTDGGYSLPVSILDFTAIAKSLGTDNKNVTIQVNISIVDPSVNDKIKTSAQNASTKQLGNAIEFSVTATGNGKTVELNNFGSTYVERSVVVKTPVNKTHATVALFDPTTGRLSFVPAVFEVQADKSTKVTFKRNGNSIYTVLDTTKTFDDVTNHWAQSDIELLASKLIVNGVTETSFAPESNITRAEFAALLVRSLGLPLDADSAAFTDVKSNDWYAGAIGAAVKAKLVDGFTDKSFKPNDAITREQMAVMVSRAIAAVGKTMDVTGKQDEILAKFMDNASISSWAQAAVAQSVGASIITGMTDNTFVPAAEATRSQAVVTLKRLLEYTDFIN